MITAYIDTILLVVGLTTASLLVQAIAPRYALRAFFGKDVEDPFSLFLARSGGLPIATIGGLLIWASFNEVIRDPILITALISKAVFLAFILINWRVTGKGYALTIVVDSVAVVLFTLYLLGL